MNKLSAASKPGNGTSNILVVDDEPGMTRYLQTLLELNSYQVETAGTGRVALEKVRNDPPPDLVLLDLLMPEMDGFETLDVLRRTRPGLKVIILTSSNDTRHAVQAMRRGAMDYLTKPISKAELEACIQASLSVAPPHEGTLEPLTDSGELGGSTFVAASPAMLELRGQAEKVARVNVPVLLLGESGTGKEVMARLIHQLSRRAQRPFLKVNCAALPADLLESELFGYEPGAFTGATRSKPGKFELCDKGTILLDEIAEMPTSLQAKLLHVLQDQEFSRLGSRTTVRVNVRVLAATNVDIPAAIEARKFREDLFYRLNAFTLHIPPLRERVEEIPLLMKQFMTLWSERYARSPRSISDRLLAACRRYPWPGNIRELENFVKRYIILAEEDVMLREIETPAPATGQDSPVPYSGNHAADLKSLVRGIKGEAEMEAIARTLDQTRWNRKQAARLLGISYKALLYKIRQYGIDRPHVSPDSH
jgi:two-component system, NtrC family, response regulator AtoC